MNKLPVAVASLALAMAGAALAQTPPAKTSSANKPHTQFSALDSNKDGRLARDEVKGIAELRSSFSALDTDHDGYLSEAEFNLWKAAAAPHTMAPANKASGTTPVHPDGVTAPASDADKSSGATK